ncbi:MAG: hypothetical protein R2764_09800 [Bacteroidales bacterium]
MKKPTTLIIALLAFAFMGIAQESDYKMWEMMYIKPKYDKLKELGEAMANHNKKFHNEDPHKASIWMAQTGPHTGKWVWVMGPCKFSDLDHRPDDSDHMEDWRDNVMPYVMDISEGEYWKLDDKVSYMPDGSFSGKEIWTVYDIAPFDGYRFTALLEKVVEVYKQKSYPNYFEVYRSQFQSGSGRDVAISFGFKTWAFFDEEDNFWKDYEEVHGEGSKWKFFEEYRDVVVSSYDEVSEYIPELSGGVKED